MLMVAETIYGAYSERFFRDVVDKYVARRKGPNLGGLSTAVQHQYRAKLDHAKQLVQAGNTLPAAALLNTLPRDAMRDPEIALLATHLDLILTLTITQIALYR